MKDIIILEQCKVCNKHLVLRESIQHENYKPYIVKYCGNGCIPVEEIVEIAVDNKLTTTKISNSIINNKDTIISYCERYTSSDISELDSKQRVLSGLKNPLHKHYLLDTCPTSCGLDNFNGECWKYGLELLADEIHCEKCWNRALGYEYFDIKVDK